MKKLCILIFLGIALTACDSQNDSELTTNISGKWNVVSLDDKDVSSFKAHLLIDAPNKQSNGTSGCNFYNAPTTIDSIKKTILLDAVITTKIGCQNELGTFELDYYNALRSIDTYTFDNENLILEEKGKKRIKLKK